MDYIRDESTLPIPFNIIPSPKSIFYILRSCFRHCCGGDDDEDTIQHPGRVVDLEMFPNTQFSGSGQGKPRVRLKLYFFVFNQ